MALVSSRFEPYGQPMQLATAIPFVSCVKCGERLFLPETSEYADTHSVHHSWKCGCCEHAFDTGSRHPARGGVGPTDNDH